MTRALDPLLVALSYLIAVLASLAALRVAANARSAPPRAAAGWHLLAALALGAGIGSVHFVALRVLGLPLAATQGALATAGPLAASLVLAALAFALAAAGERAPGRMPGASLALVGAIAVAGLVPLPPPAFRAPDAALLVAVLASGAMASFMGLSLAARATGDGVPPADRRRLPAALVLGLAVAGVVYGIAAAVRFPAVAAPAAAAFTGFWTAIAVTCGATLLLAVAMLLGETDVRPTHATGTTLRRRIGGAFLFAALVAAGLAAVAVHDTLAADAQGSAARLVGIAIGAVLLIAFVGRRLAAAIATPVAALQDVTERQRATEALQRSNAHLSDMNRRLQQAQDQLLQAEKMASIGQLASGVAHEINNPIGYVYSNLGTLAKYMEGILALLDRYAEAERAVGDGAALAAIAQAKRAADIDFVKQDLVALLAESREGITRVRKIVQDLRNFSRTASDEDLQEADLHAGLESTLNIVWNELKYKAEVVRDFGPVPPVECRPSQLNQVFLNLLVNAAQAIRQRGTIRVATGCEDGMAWVEVADDGQGIRPEHVSRIFDPFFTTKAAGHGTGLGLALSYRIVDEHHGRIEVASEWGVGTRFRVWLPLRQPQAAAA